MKTVLITTALRGVWCAKVAEDADLTARTLTDLHDAIVQNTHQSPAFAKPVLAEVIF